MGFRGRDSAHYNPYISETALKGLIVAEILFYREAVKKIGAESPVFCGVSRKKCARKMIWGIKMFLYKSIDCV
jgi:hypothetical protein